MKYVEETGILPRGSDQSFGQGGCTGEAASSIGSVWDFRRQSSDAVDGLHADALLQPEARESLSQYSACVETVTGLEGISNQGDLEDATGDGVIDDRTADRAVLTCDHHWETARAEGEAALTQSFFDQHSAAIEQQLQRYDGAVEQIVSNDRFVDYLVGRARVE